MTIDPPQDAVLGAILQRAFSDRGEDLFLVGGAVRDALMDRVSGDLDFTTSAPPEETLAIITELGLGEPYRIGEKFGTIGLQMRGGRIEITTYRAERYDVGSRKPQVRFGTSLLDDLKRRDFTVNAIAQDPATSQYIDPFGGRHDLEYRLLRAVGDPNERFSEDPLRLLRAVRFATRLGFEIEATTWAAMIGQQRALVHISRERIRDEYEKILVSDRVGQGLTLLRDSGLLSTSVPDLKILTSMPDHGPNHLLSLWDHTVRVVEAVNAEPRLRWAALLHDIGKPSTRSLEADGRIRFFHHEEVGARMARAILGGLRYPNGFIADVETLVDTHMHIHAYVAEWSDGAVRRLVHRLGSLLPTALDLARADANGHSLVAPALNAPRLDALELRIESLAGTLPQVPKSPLTGNDLMQRYGRPPGPWIRTTKDMLENEVIEGRLAPDDTASAWALADSWMEHARTP